MAFSSTNVVVFFFTLFLTATTMISGSNYFQDFDITWGQGRGKIVNNGDLLTLSLDNYSGSGFQSKKEYLFGKIEMQLKLVPGNSAGTVTALYLSSGGSNHDEIDFEFLGNVSGDPYTVHTNVYTQGRGEREQQFHLCFSVDNTPIRQFKNLENKGVPFPKSQPMKLYSSIWNADEWATRGGLIKTDWSRAPFTASYRNFNADACVVSYRYTPYCTSTAAHSTPWASQKLDPYSEEKLKWVQKNYMIYNYCNDSKRFPQGFPPECYA